MARTSGVLVLSSNGTRIRERCPNRIYVLGLFDCCGWQSPDVRHHALVTYQIGEVGRKHRDNVQQADDQQVTPAAPAAPACHRSCEQVCVSHSVRAGQGEQRSGATYAAPMEKRMVVAKP